MMRTATAEMSLLSQWSNAAQSFRSTPRQRRQRFTTAAASSPAAPQPQSSSNPCTRRQSLLLGSLLLTGSAFGSPPPSRANEAATATAATATSSAGEELIPFSNPAQGYSLLRPASWEQVDKAGADALFRDPQRKSTTVGITVLPVMIERLDQFGDLDSVGQRLLAAEQAKESTLPGGVAMVAQAARSQAGVPTYDFEYELDSTRGRKRVFSTVYIAGRKLFIANGSVSCGKQPACSGDAEAVLPLVRRVTQSLAAAAP